MPMSSRINGAPNSMLDFVVICIIIKKKNKKYNDCGGTETGRVFFFFNSRSL